MTEQKRKNGRPPREIDWQVFKDLCNIMCTPEEIASVLKIDRATLYYRVETKYKEKFSTIYKRYTEGAKSSIRRMQFALGEKNAGMAIWLGKQYLGQKDDISKSQEELEETVRNLKEYIEDKKVSADPRTEADSLDSGEYS